MIHVYFDNVYQVNLYRLEESQMNRNFDMEIVTKDSERYMFSGIERNESENLVAFFKGAGLGVQVVKSDSVVNSESEEVV